MMNRDRAVPERFYPRAGQEDSSPSWHKTSIVPTVNKTEENIKTD